MVVDAESIDALKPTRQPGATSATSSDIAFHIRRFEGQMTLATIERQGLVGLKTREADHHLVLLGGAVGSEAYEFVALALG